ncbi:MAG: transglycosylase family protein [Actinomycetota bacterium]
MAHSPHRRLSQAEGLVVLVLLVAFASAAWAEVIPPGNSARSAQLSFTQAVALSAEPDGVRAESQELRVHLIKENREDRREAQRKRRRIVAQRQAAAVSSTSSSSYGSHADWDAIAQCESGGVWAASTGNGYWGGLQFAPNTWFAYGGGPYDGSGPFPYSREQQIAVAERVLAAQGPGAWPNCFAWG